jgi:hypothetical protein
LKDNEITPQVVKELRKTDKKLDEMITTYLNSRFIPDAETLLA